MLQNIIIKHTLRNNTHHTGQSAAAYSVADKSKGKRIHQQHMTNEGISALHCLLIFKYSLE